MKCEEFVEKYNLSDIMDMFNNKMAKDYIVAGVIAITLVFTIVTAISDGNSIPFIICVILGGAVWIAYSVWSRQKRQEYVKDEMFLDMVVHLSDGDLPYQVKIDALTEGDGSGRIYINGEFILNYDKCLLDRPNNEDILVSFVDNVIVITPWGLEKAKHVNSVNVVYEGEAEVEGLTLPILNIIITGAGIRGIL